MGGLGVLIVIAMYIAFAIFVVRMTPTRWGKAIAVFAVVLLPTGDALWGRYVTLPKLCQDAGLKVFKQAEKEDGLFDVGADVISKFGIEFVEGRYGNGVFHRRSMSNGQIVLEEGVESKARYLLEQIPINKDKNVKGLSEGTEIHIKERSTGEIIARYRTYGFGGGWAERFLGGFAGSGPQTGAGCPGELPIPEYALIQATFK